VPGVAATAALMRCGECHRISMASMVRTTSQLHGSRDLECRTPLGRFEAAAWVPASLYVHPLILQLKTQHKRGRFRQCG
jgi:hypothetical protein